MEKASVIGWIEHPLIRDIELYIIIRMMFRVTLKFLSSTSLSSLSTFRIGKDYSGAKFFYTEPISLNKAHSTK